MAKREFKPLTWKVKNYCRNTDEIWDYDVLKYREDFIKKLKKKCATIEEFAEKMRREMRCQYWSRCEYEVIIEVDENNHIWLKPWVGCQDPESVKIDVTNDENFDWRGFAKKHIGNQIYKNKAKIDIWDQIDWRWDEFIDYCWYTRLKYERDDPKFHRTCKDCTHFIGGGDWDLCCTEPHEGYPFGFLCYEDTPACEKFDKKDNEREDNV